ncbi:MAG: PfkB family carbohydrate kinase [Actinomycetota bacterium]|nr:PfkB family carbohydrate kinase [Actinomycetota bacterium]
MARQAGRRGVPVACFDGHAEEARLVIWSRREHPDEEEALRLSDGRTVVLTDGPRAVTAFSDGRRLLVQPPAVPARDTTGAGDVFAAMCALGLLRAWEMDWTLFMAATAASLLVATGRAMGIPALQAIEEAASRAGNSPESAPTTTHSACSAAAQPPTHH